MFSNLLRRTATISREVRRASHRYPRQQQKQSLSYISAIARFTSYHSSLSLSSRTHSFFSSTNTSPNKHELSAEQVKATFVRAQCYFRQDNFERSLELLESISPLINNELKILKTLGNTYVALQQFEEALATFDRVIKLSPGDIEANVVSMGIIEKLYDEYDERLEDITDRITNHHAEDSGQQIALALGSLLQEEYPVIIELLKNPSSFQEEQQRFLVYALVKEAMTRLGQKEEAINLLEEALTNLTERREEIFFLLAKLYSETGNTVKEKQNLIEGLELDAQQFDVITELAWIIFKEGDKEQATKLLGQAMLIEPNYSKIYFYQARICQQEKNLDEAEVLLKKCIEIDGESGSGMVQNQLGVLALQRGNAKAAVSQFFKALDINNEEAQYYFNLALAFKFSKENSRAVSYYEKGLLLQPKNTMIILELARLLVHMKKYHNAVEYFRQAAQLEEKSADIRVELAQTYNLVGDRNNAIKIVNEALAIDPEHTAANALSQQVQRTE